MLCVSYLAVIVVPLIFGGKWQIGFIRLNVLFFVQFPEVLFLVAVQTLSHKMLYQNNPLGFPKKITKTTQGMATYDWEVLATNLNSYFYGNKIWNRSFDGFDCERFFSHCFYRLLSSKKSMFDISLNVELWLYIKEA